MHIVLTVNAAWNIWNFRRPLVEALLEDGHLVTILAPADEASARLKEIGCDTVPLDMDAKGVNPLNDIRLRQDLGAHFARLRPDAILSFTIKNNIYGALAARRLGIPFFPTVTGLGTAFLSLGPMQFVIEWLYRRAFRALPAVLFQNGDDAALFVERGLVRADQVRLVAGSGIDLARFPLTDYPPAQEGCTFLLIARIIRDKGIAEFVEAAAQVRQRHPDARFQLLGEAGAANRTAFGLAQVEAWQRSGAIEYLGSASDVRPAIRAAHAVVLPSYREGAPRTLIEAGAMGRPAIATDVPGCRSVVEDQVTGFLCQPRSAASLAHAMERFIALPQAVRAQMGRAAHERIAGTYAVEKVIAVYRDLLAGAAR